MNDTDITPTQTEHPGSPLDDSARAAVIFRAICDAVPVGLFFTDPDGISVYTNTMNQRQMGLTFEEALGDGWQRAIHPEDRERVFRDFRRAIGRGDVYRGPNRYLRPDGTIVEVMVKVASVAGPDGPVGFVGVAEDITEEEERRREKSRAEHLEAIGRLAGGVAHDFNNLLTVILGFAELLRYAPEQAENGAEEILRAGARARALTDQLLVFARRQITDPEVLDPIAGLRDVHPVLRRLIPEHIDVSLVFSDEPSWLVLIDPTQFEQLIINLCINARDAMPRGGQVTIEVVNRHLEAGSLPDDVDPGDYVEMKVSDTGSGMSEETIARVFEPFYTTKGDRGTGLGLATCHGIVNRAGGHIWVHSEPERGTSFKILFPRARGTIGGHRPDPADTGPLRGRETVLILEDESKLRELLSTALSGLGYTVLTAENGQTGVALANELDRIDIVVSDVVMPLMTGPEAVSRILARHPNTAVLYTSGYTQDVTVEDAVQKPGLLLPKPFTPRDLARRIRGIFDAHSPEPTDGAV